MSETNQNQTTTTTIAPTVAADPPLVSILKYGVPWILTIAGGLVAIAAILSSTSDSVKIGFVGAATTAFGAAAGLARSPSDSKPERKSVEVTRSPDSTDN